MKKWFFTVIICAVAASGFTVQQAFAAPPQQTIVANCRNAQVVLGQLEKADAVQRINRGRLYNNVLNLLFAMNARLSVNRILATDLTDITQNFSTGFANFRNDYDKYDDSLNDLINADCVAQPDDFYNQLNNVRADRAKLASDVANLDNLINNYKTGLTNATKGAE